jgi:hypothetical protein
MSEGLFFCIEHPRSASSWNRQNMKLLKQMTGVFTTSFDQCMYGLKSKCHHTPILKATTLISNMPSIQTRFSTKCDKGHSHVACAGYEGGELRSAYSQRYPERMCQMIAGAVQETATCSTK